jgi:phage gp36-like protein
MDYLTTDEYLQRYGARETVLLTNETALAQGQQAEVDTAKVQSVIDDATAVVDAYIGVRYVLPIPSVPLVVKGWVRILARELLMGRKATPEAVDQANTVRAQLKDLSTGKMSLPLPEGSPAPESAAGGTATTSGDGSCPTITRGLMAEYMGDVGGYGCQGGAWRQGR